MGRRPKPTHLRIVEGTLEGHKGKGRAKRAGKEPVPAGRLDPDSPPEWFDEERRSLWKFYIEQSPPGLLRSLDRALMSNWCNAVACYDDAARKAAASSLLVKRQDGNVGKNPLHQLVSQYGADVKMYAAELGFSPASRTRISIDEGADPDDPLDRFFK